MKKRICPFMIFFLFCLCCGSLLRAEGINAAQAAETVPGTEPERKNGWQKDAEGNRMQYYKNGVLVTGLRTIEGKTYFFDARGNLKRNAWCKYGQKTYRTNENGVALKNQWKTINKKRYHFAKQGVRAEGRKKIGKKYYFFNSRGVLKKGTVKDGKTTYYANKKGVLRGYKIKKKYYFPKGKKMPKVKARNFETMLTAEKIASDITKPGMSKSRKLRVCFDWVMKKYYRTRREFTNFDGWPAVYANDHFKYGSGDCHADAAAFAYLAKAIGYDKVYVCSDSRGKSAHSWTEVNGRAYDPLFAQSKSFSRNYGVKYGVYRLSPVLHIKIKDY